MVCLAKSMFRPSDRWYFEPVSQGREIGRIGPIGPRIGLLIAASAHRDAGSERGGWVAELLAWIAVRELRRRLPDAVVIETFESCQADADVDLVVSPPAETPWLAARWFSPELLDKRLAFVRAMGWLEHGAAAGASAVASLPDHACVADVLAVVRAAGDDQAGRDVDRVAPEVRAAVDALSAAGPTDAAARADSAFDALADAVTKAADERWLAQPVDVPSRWWATALVHHEQYRSLQAAYDERGERLLIERAAMADEVDRLASELHALRSGLGFAELEREHRSALRELERLRGERTRLQGEIARLGQLVVQTIR